MATRHEMAIEGRGRRTKRAKVKKSKKSSAIGRQLRSAKRQAWNILGGVGFVTVIVLLFQLARGGW